MVLNLIPKNININKAETLAIWFMDDGGRGQIILYLFVVTEAQKVRQF